MFRTVSLSIIRSFSLYTAMVYVIQVCWELTADGQRNCPKHVEFYSKNKFEKSVHLVGFIIRIYRVYFCRFLFLLLCNVYRHNNSLWYYIIVIQLRIPISPGEYLFDSEHKSVAGQCRHTCDNNGLRCQPDYPLSHFILSLPTVYFQSKV